jgi:hypothetical protein
MLGILFTKEFGFISYHSSIDSRIHFFPIQYWLLRFSSSGILISIWFSFGIHIRAHPMFKRNLFSDWQLAVDYWKNLTFSSCASVLSLTFLSVSPPLPSIPILHYQGNNKTVLCFFFITTADIDFSKPEINELSVLEMIMLMSYSLEVSHSFVLYYCGDSLGWGPFVNKT